MLRSCGHIVAHRIWVAGLMASSVLPACSLPVGALQRTLWHLWTLQSTAGPGNVHILMGEGHSGGHALRLAPALQGIVLAVWLVVVGWHAAKLAYGILRTRRLAGSAEPADMSPKNAERFAAMATALGLSRLPRIAVSPQVAAPVTIGSFAPLILLPSRSLRSLASGDLQAVLAHELAHIARHDFAKNLLYRAWMLPVAWHPAARLLRGRLAETREVFCDSIAAQIVSGRRPYARSLLRLALLYGQPERKDVPVAAVGIFDFSNTRTLERRVMALHQNLPIMGTARKAVLAAACLILAASTGAAALTLHTGIDSSPAAQASSAKPRSIPAQEMAGMKIGGDNPSYPAEAKKKRIQGKVVLAAEISPEGAVRHVRVVESPSRLLSDSARKAVETWKYHPYLLNGNPVAVDTTINVIFSLGS